MIGICKYYFNVLNIYSSWLVIEEKLELQYVQYILFSYVLWKKITNSKLYNKCKNTGKSNANSLDFCQMLVTALCLENKNLALWVFQNILFFRYSFEKIYWKTFLVCHLIFWYEKMPLDHFCISFSLIQACAARWSEFFFSIFIDIFSWSQICAVSFSAVDARHKVSTRKIASTSIYEEFHLITLKQSYWSLFLFNKTYFHKRWKGEQNFSAMERRALDGHTNTDIEMDP